MAEKIIITQADLEAYYQSGEYKNVDFLNLYNIRITEEIEEIILLILDEMKDSLHSYLAESISDRIMDALMKLGPNLKRVECGTLIIGSRSGAYISKESITKLFSLPHLETIFVQKCSMPEIQTTMPNLKKLYVGSFVKDDANEFKINFGLFPKLEDFQLLTNKNTTFTGISSVQKMDLEFVGGANVTCEGSFFPHLTDLSTRCRRANLSQLFAVCTNLQTVKVNYDNIMYVNSPKLTSLSVEAPGDYNYKDFKRFTSLKKLTCRFPDEPMELPEGIETIRFNDARTPVLFEFLPDNCCQEMQLELTSPMYVYTDLRSDVPRSYKDHRVIIDANKFGKSLTVDTLNVPVTFETTGSLENKKILYKGINDCAKFYRH